LANARKLHYPASNSSTIDQQHHLNITHGQGAGMPVRLSPVGSRPGAAVALATASLVAGATLGYVFASTAHDAWMAIEAAGPAGPADGILLVAGLGGTLLSLWLGLGMTLSALSALPGALGQLCRRLAGRIAPAAVRKVVAFVLGTTLTAALIPGTAAAGSSPEAGRPAVVAAARYEDRAVRAVHTVKGLAAAAPDASFRFVSDPLQAKDITEAAPPPDWSPERPERPDRHEARVVVLRGDTLWSIAARHLGRAATAADIDAEWQRWLAANRDVIGADANLILPGQLLRPPPPRRAGS
jgi:nucleoid-associated protein YgaU